MTRLKRGSDLLPGTTRCRMRALRFATLCVTATSFAVIAQPSFADKCTITTTPVVFGSYDVFETTDNVNGVGTLTIGGVGKACLNSYPVTLGTGQSGNYAARVMKDVSGANSLYYNLYTNPARTIIWGDGNGGSSSVTAVQNVPLSVFGRISAGQDAAIGFYSDFITATVTY